MLPAAYTYISIWVTSFPVRGDDCRMEWDSLYGLPILGVFFVLFCFVLFVCLFVWGFFFCFWFVSNVHKVQCSDLLFRFDCESYATLCCHLSYFLPALYCRTGICCRQHNVMCSDLQSATRKYRQNQKSPHFSFFWFARYRPKASRLS